MARAFATCAVAYGVAAAVAVGFGSAIGWEHPIAVAFGADVAATLVVFGFSRAYDNSSFYDPYWSVAPIPIAVYWAIAAETPAVNPVRQVLVVALVALWGARLTFNWGRGWKGLGHEDWRYVDLREKHPRTYWWVSAFGLHLMPTLIVFVGCLPLYPSLATATAPVGPLDALAVLVTGGAIWIEARADKQLRRFVTSQPAPGAILSDGLSRPVRPGRRPVLVVDRDRRPGHHVDVPLHQPSPDRGPDGRAAAAVRGPRRAHLDGGSVVPRLGRMGMRRERRT
jgi:steroid 5-alpha reductase family enzyme